MGARQPVPHASRRRPVRRSSDPASRLRPTLASAPVAEQLLLTHSCELLAHVKGEAGLGGRGGAGGEGGGDGLGGGLVGATEQSAPEYPFVHVQT